MHSPLPRGKEPTPPKKHEREDSKERKPEEHTAQPKVAGGKGKKTPVFSKSNNRQLIKNAITNVCLAGEPNRKKREEVLQQVSAVAPDRNIVILFKEMMGGRQVSRQLI